MLRSLSRFASLALVAAVSLAAHALQTVHVAATWLRDWAYSGLENLHQAPAGEISSKPTVARVRAHAFVARLVKRERPRVTSQWRMCPSV
jgi:hypothetical protein